MRASPPPVTVITSSDFWLSELRAGRAFYRGVQTGGSDATHQPNVQLKNPIGSGVQVSIYAAHAMLGGTTAEVHLDRFDTDLGTDVGAGFNCLEGGAAAQAHLRSDITTNPAGVRRVGWFTSVANSAVLLPHVWVAELSPGQGLMFTGVAFTMFMDASFWWREGA
jgi:hypothetical protein